jgi:lysophospholipase
MPHIDSLSPPPRGKTRWRSILSIIAGLPLLLLLALLSYNPDPPNHEPSEHQMVQALRMLQQSEAQLPNGWQWNSLDIGKGRSIRYGQAGGNRTDIIVYIPGFTSMVEQYAPVLNALHMNGTSVVGVDLPGQGGSSRLLAHPQKAWVESFDIYVQSVHLMIAVLRKQYPDHKITLIGESLGGHVALRASMAKPGLTDRLILVAPVLNPSTGGFPRWFAKAVANAKTATGSGEEWSFGQGPRHFKLTDPAHACGADPKRMEIYHAWNIANRDQRLGGATNQWVASLLQSADVIKEAGNFDSAMTEILLISPRNDSFTDPVFNEALCKASKNCRAITLPKARHCPWFDPSPQPEKLIEHVAAFVERGSDSISLR